jgi:hypothetical protein
MYLPCRVQGVANLSPRGWIDRLASNSSPKGECRENILMLDRTVLCTECSV